MSAPLTPEQKAAAELMLCRGMIPPAEPLNPEEELAIWRVVTRGHRALSPRGRITQKSLSAFICEICEYARDLIEESDREYFEDYESRRRRKRKRGNPS